MDVNGELMCEARNKLVSLLDRVEELERELVRQRLRCEVAEGRQYTAESELSTLKAQVERLKHHVEHYCGECQEEILAILDGKEG